MSISNLNLFITINDADFYLTVVPSSFENAVLVKLTDLLDFLKEELFFTDSSDFLEISCKIVWLSTDFDLTTGALFSKLNFLVLFMSRPRSVPIVKSEQLVRTRNVLLLPLSLAASLSRHPLIVVVVVEELVDDENPSNLSFCFFALKLLRRNTILEFEFVVWLVTVALENDATEIESSSFSAFLCSLIIIGRSDLLMSLT